MRQRGITLIELAIALVIISIGVVGILKVMELTTRHSADPLLQHQAMIVAEAYLEEILAKAYDDPESETGSCEEGLPASARGLYDDVNDYGCIAGANSDHGAHDQFGNAIAGLEGYTVSVAVTSAVLDDGVAARRVEVHVTYGNLVAIVLTGYCTDH